MRQYDIAIVGAGIAGASLAAAIGRGPSVLLIEAEDRPGRHSTGRSAAFWSETYGGPAVQPLTSASGAWLRAPPADYGEIGFLDTRGSIHIAAVEDEPALDALAAEFAGRVALEPLDRAALERAVPGLRSGFRRGLLEPSCADIDVAALHAACLKVARRAGAELLCDAPVRAIEPTGQGWRITAGDAVVGATTLVNAAGAWAGEIARMAGAADIAITPNRRTIVQVRTDPDPPAGLPLVIDAAGRFYFKGEAGGRLWLSPHDETPVTAQDVAPEELDVAIAIDRLEHTVDWRVVARERAWAGLRSFAPDRAPVYGFDPRAAGFFWCAGQGGFGIQTAPAAAALAAALLLDRPLPEWIAGIDPALYAPTRFAGA